MRLIALIIITFSVGVLKIYSIQVVMEDSRVYEVNMKYMKYANSSVFRYKNKGLYYLRIQGETRHTWANNVTVHMLFFEYIRNEFRRSFVEVHMRFCDLVNRDPYIGKMLARANLICPLPPMDICMDNMTVDITKYRFRWPWKKAKVDIVITENTHDEVIVKGYVVINFKK